jgi:hypothetical protein
LEVLRVFLKLGVSSFGGPIAHVGYFREEFIVSDAGSTSKHVWRASLTVVVIVSALGGIAPALGR